MFRSLKALSANWIKQLRENSRRNWLTSWKA
nr:MAG TPA: hypothetical protein [Caudoviricetes sp.]